MKKILLAAAIIAISMTACESPDNSETPPQDITYKVVQTGGTNNTVTTTGIVFTFSADIESLNVTANDITVGGVASKGSATFTE
jgi:hypothetical protein